MSDQFVGEIRVFPFNFAPTGWALCNGQILPISQNTALFSLLGTNYGGNGTSNFALPNLQGSFPLDAGSGVGLTPRVLGETGGAPTSSLVAGNLPAHSHNVACSTAAGNSLSPAGAVFAGAASAAYGPQGTAANLKPSIVSSAGGGQPHANMPPYLALNFCIALQGIFPPRS